MKDVIVVVGVTHRAGLLDTYERQVLNAGIDFHIEMTSFVTRNFNMQLRLDYWHTLAMKFRDYKQIIITDGWDVLFFGTKQDLLDKLQTVIISGERNCFPESHLASAIKGSPWRYANPGMIAANPDCLLEWCAKAKNTQNLEVYDQAWCNRRLADNSGLVEVDESTSLFYVISTETGWLEDGTLQIKNERLWNSVCDTYPNFFHFAGHGIEEALRVLPDHPLPRYEAMNIIRGCM